MLLLFFFSSGGGFALLSRVLLSCFVFLSLFFFSILLLCQREKKTRKHIYRESITRRRSQIGGNNTEAYQDLKYTSPFRAPGTEGQTQDKRQALSFLFFFLWYFPVLFCSFVLERKRKRSLLTSLLKWGVLLVFLFFFSWFCFQSRMCFRLIPEEKKKVGECYTPASK